LKRRQDRQAEESSPARRKKPTQGSGQTKGHRGVARGKTHQGGSTVAARFQKLPAEGVEGLGAWLEQG